MNVFTRMGIIWQNYYVYIEMIFNLLRLNFISPVSIYIWYPFYKHFLQFEDCFNYNSYPVLIKHPKYLFLMSHFYSIFLITLTILHDTGWCFSPFFGYTHIFIVENLSRKPSTLLTQSTTFQSQGAFLANDGQKSTSYGDCTHTAPNRSSAWLQVDLRKVYTVESVNIYYRNEGLLFSSFHFLKI